MFIRNIYIDFYMEILLALDKDPVILMYVANTIIAILGISLVYFMIVMSSKWKHSLSGR
jgi:hypothetical protein